MSESSDILIEQWLRNNLAYVEDDVEGARKSLRHYISESTTESFVLCLQRDCDWTIDTEHIIVSLRQLWCAVHDVPTGERTEKLSAPDVRYVSAEDEPSISTVMEQVYGHRERAADDQRFWDQAACAALSGILAHPDCSSSVSGCTLVAANYADALLSERRKRGAK